MKQLDDYRDKHIVVLGLAKSGVQVAKVLHQAGASVIVNDRKEREQCPEASELEALGILLFAADIPMTLFIPACRSLSKPGNSVFGPACPKGDRA